MHTETRRKELTQVVISVVLSLIICVSAFPKVNLQAAGYEGTYYLMSGVGSNMTLDVAGGKTSNRANIQIYKKNGTAAQQFKIEKYGSYYKITNVKSGKSLDVAGGGKNNKANVQQYTWNKTKAQQWKIQNAGGGYVYIINAGSGKALDVAGAKAKNGQNVWQYTLNKSKAQKWKLVKATTSSATGSSSATSTKQKSQTSGISSGTVYTITSAVNKNFALEVKGGAKTNKANVQLGKNTKAASQRWKIVWNNGYYKIINVNSGRVLDISGGKTANKTNVQQYAWNGTKAQNWKIVKNADGTYSFVSALSDTIALDLSGGKAAAGRNIWIYSYNKSKAQKWYITKYTAPAKTSTTSSGSNTSTTTGGATDKSGNSSTTTTTTPTPTPQVTATPTPTPTPTHTHSWEPVYETVAKYYPEVSHEETRVLTYQTKTFTYQACNHCRAMFPDYYEDIFARADSDLSYEHLMKHLGDTWKLEELGGESCGGSYHLDDVHAGDVLNICDDCGAMFKTELDQPIEDSPSETYLSRYGTGEEQLARHQAQFSHTGSRTVTVPTIYTDEPETTTLEKVVDQEEHYEFVDELTGYKCSCGATKSK